MALSLAFLNLEAKSNSKINQTLIKKMDKHLKQTNFSGHHQIEICGSKSESNRLLILKALYPNITIDNLSTSDDTKVLQKAFSTNNNEINIHHAGTAMRFLTAYLACFTTKPVVITGSERMQNRPIKILVEALRQIGAKIEYVDKEGYPPLKISPSTISKNEVSLKADVSSQYISALMLVAPKLPNGLNINFTSKITSLPYLKMTQKLMQNLSFQVDFDVNCIRIPSKAKIEKTNFQVESDWSSASYFYSLVALSPQLSLTLKTFKTGSLQGDSKLAELYESLGVKTDFQNNAIHIKNTKNIKLETYEQNLNNTPDLAQTIAVTCLGIGLKCHLKGLHTLKIKETDRLLALKNEMEKFGATVKIGEDSLIMITPESLNLNQSIKTYNDHRMAMAFAPMMALTDLKILDADVVSKSFPRFWEDLDLLKK